MIKLKNYEAITIYGWMINELHLEGFRLLLFAALWNYCLGGTKIEWAWLDYICSWLNSLGYNVNCEELDPYINGFYEKGFIGIDKDGLWVMRHIEELQD